MKNEEEIHFMQKYVLTKIMYYSIRTCIVCKRYSYTNHQVCKLLDATKPYPSCTYAIDKLQLRITKAIVGKHVNNKP